MMRALKDVTQLCSTHLPVRAVLDASLTLITHSPISANTIGTKKRDWAAPVYSYTKTLHTGQI